MSVQSTFIWANYQLPYSPYCMIYLWWETERENWSWSLLGVNGLKYDKTQQVVYQTLKEIHWQKLYYGASINILIPAPLICSNLELIYEWTLLQLLYWLGNHCLVFSESYPGPCSPLAASLSGKDAVRTRPGVKFSAATESSTESAGGIVFVL